jgi:uncharacterized lipoprotein YmbA
MCVKCTQSVFRLSCFAVLLLVSSCAATIAKPHLYFLTSVPAAQSTTQAEGARCAPVTVSVHLPAYLQRDGLVLQLNDNELVAAQSHLWAEPLVYGVERLLKVCLNPLPSSDAAASAATKPILQVKVVVEQLHGNAEGLSRLQATWSAINVNDTVPASAHRFSAQAQQGEPGYAALVSVQRSLLLDLCQQVSERLAQCIE